MEKSPIKTALNEAPLAKDLKGELMLSLYVDIINKNLAYFRKKIKFFWFFNQVFLFL
jgi:hypothetical protein